MSVINILPLVCFIRLIKIIFFSLCAGTLDLYNLPQHRCKINIFWAKDTCLLYSLPELGHSMTSLRFLPKLSCNNSSIHLFIQSIDHWTDIYWTRNLYVPNIVLSTPEMKVNKPKSLFSFKLFIRDVDWRETYILFQGLMNSMKKNHVAKETEGNGEQSYIIKQNDRQGLLLIKVLFEWINCRAKPCRYLEEKDLRKWGQEINNLQA